jgi:hypothetical protein
MTVRPSCWLGILPVVNKSNTNPNPALKFTRKFADLNTAVLHVGAETSKPVEPMLERSR